MLIDFIKKIIQKLFFKSKKNKNEMGCESVKQYQSTDDRKIDKIVLSDKKIDEKVKKMEKKYL